jgi:hypothetical protein
MVLKRVEAVRFLPVVLLLNFRSGGDAGSCITLDHQWKYHTYSDSLPSCAIIFFCYWISNVLFELHPSARSRIFVYPRKCPDLNVVVTPIVSRMHNLLLKCSQHIFFKRFSFPEVELSTFGTRHQIKYRRLDIWRRGKPSARARLELFIGAMQEKGADTIRFAIRFDTHIK